MIDFDNILKIPKKFSLEIYAIGIKNIDRMGRHRSLLLLFTKLYKPFLIVSYIFY